MQLVTREYKGQLNITYIGDIINSTKSTMKKEKRLELLASCKRVFEGSSTLNEQNIITLVTYLCPLSKEFESDPTINFSNDIVPFEYQEHFEKPHTMRRRKVTDVVSLIKYLRDTTLHPELYLDFDETNLAKIKFCAFKGKGCLASLVNRKLESEYDDDIAYFHGKATIYHNRHLGRVITEIDNKLSNTQPDDSQCNKKTKTIGHPS